MVQLFEKSRFVGCLYVCLAGSNADERPDLSIGRGGPTSRRSCFHRRHVFAGENTLVQSKQSSQINQSRYFPHRTLNVSVGADCAHQIILFLAFVSKVIS